MSTILLILEMFVTLALIGVVLIQRSEGGGLGIGSSQGMGSFMSGRGTANLLTRTTAILAALFMALALALALLNHGTSGVGGGDPGSGTRFGTGAGNSGQAERRSRDAERAVLVGIPHRARAVGIPRSTRIGGAHRTNDPCRADARRARQARQAKRSFRSHELTRA